MTGYTPNIEIDGAEISRQIKAAYADQLHKSSNFFFDKSPGLFYFIFFYKKTIFIKRINQILRTKPYKY